MDRWASISEYESWILNEIIEQQRIGAELQTRHKQLVELQRRQQQIFEDEQNYRKYGFIIIDHAMIDQISNPNGMNFGFGSSLRQALDDGISDFDKQRRSKAIAAANEDVELRKLAAELEKLKSRLMKLEKCAKDFQYHRKDEQEISKSRILLKEFSLNNQHSSSSHSGRHKKYAGRTSSYYV